ncbi:MAG: VCBS repeat-containing protein [Bryobacteraceae bacterium]
MLPLVFALSTMATGPGPYHLAAGDLNGDGFPDLAAPCRGELLSPAERRPANDTVTVYLTRGSPQWVERKDLKTGFGPYTAAIADLDGDNRNDLAVVNFQANDGRNLSIFWGPLTGQAQHVRVEGGPFDYDKNRTKGGDPVYPTPGLTSVAAVDANRDGRMDLVAVAWSSDFFVLLENLGERRFRQRRFPLPPGPRDVAVADFDGDGVMDLAFSIYSANLVEVWRGDGKGSFAKAHTFHSQGHVPYHLKATDIDGDGKPDLIVGNRGPSDNIVLFRNEGSSFRFGGSFGTATERRGEATVDEIRDVLVHDFDGDGIPDLLAACHVSHKVVLWRGTREKAFGRAFSQAREWTFPGKGPRALVATGVGVAIAMFDANELAIIPKPQRP